MGFASFGDFRAWPGYRHSCEQSVHVRADQRGMGVGRRLVEALFPRAEALGKHVMLAAVDADNAASINFHERLGFVRVGHFREVGRKFDRWRSTSSSCSDFSARRPLERSAHRLLCAPAPQHGGPRAGKP